MVGHDMWSYTPVFCGFIYLLDKSNRHSRLCSTAQDHICLSVPVGLTKTAALVGQDRTGRDRTEQVCLVDLPWPEVSPSTYPRVAVLAATIPECTVRFRTVELAFNWWRALCLSSAGCHCQPWMETLGQFSVDLPLSVDRRFNDYHQ
jgi:hypothetical protein